MIDRILYYYQKCQYWPYRNEKELDGYVFYTFAEVLGDEALREIDGNVIIDLSSLASILMTQESLLYNIERLLACAGEKATYIVEDKYKDFMIYFMKYVFRNAELVNISVENEMDGKQQNEKAIIQNHMAKKVIDLNEEELTEFLTEFDTKLYGHIEFKKELRGLINSFRVFNKIGEHKILSLFLMGESGIGKTEVARALHKALKGSKKLAKISFGNYSSKDSLNNLIGSPLGYIGSDGGELMKRIHDSDTGIILIDEFEKADTPVFNYFLDVLENGKIVNTQAEEYDADGYIIVFTSNISREQFYKDISPELRSRFDYKGIFEFLTDEDKKKFLLYRINCICDKYEIIMNISITKKQRGTIFGKIDYHGYKNMRDLNKKIKDTFVEFLSVRE